MNQRDIEPMLKDFTTSLARALGPALKRVLLFGSYARGEAGPDSDIDVLVVVDGNGSLREHVIDVAADVSLKYSVVLAPLIRTASAWRRLEAIQAPITQSIAREGIVLWPNPTN